LVPRLKPLEQATDDGAPIEHRFVNVNGVRLHVAAQGEGPLVVMCHGFPGLWSSFRRQLSAVAAQGWRAMAIDQRGCGRSDAPKAVEDYEDGMAVEDLVGLLDAFDERDAVFVGHDFGARQVWQTAVRHPDRVRGAIVLSVPYNPRRSTAPPSEQYARTAKEHFLHKHYFQEVGPADRELDGDPRGFLMRLFFALSGESDYIRTVWSRPSEGNGYLDVLPERSTHPSWLTSEEFEYFVAEFTRTGFTGGLNWYRAADVSWERSRPYDGATISVPTLFVVGEHDSVPDQRGADSVAVMREHLLDLRDLVVVPGAGHFVQMERTAEVNAAIVSFLESLRSTPSP